MVENKNSVVKHTRKALHILVNLKTPTKISRIVNIEQAILETQTRMKWKKKKKS